MAKRPARPKKKSSSNGHDLLKAPEAAVISEVVKLFPKEWRRSPAWKHFQVAQVEFLTGMQFLVKELLERMKVPAEQDSELKRIPVQK